MYGSAIIGMLHIFANFSVIIQPNQTFFGLSSKYKAKKFCLRSVQIIKLINHLTLLRS